MYKGHVATKKPQESFEKNETFTVCRKKLQKFRNKT